NRREDDEVIPLSNPILESIRRLLTDAGVPYREVQHAPTFTSEESAKARGEELRTGGKALLLKTDDVFRLFVLPADRKLDSAAVKRHLGVRKTRFATADELKDLAGLVPGSVPPFGPPILPFELYVDEAIRANERIAFNAGSLTDSIILATADYLAAARPALFAFSIPPSEPEGQRG
ncbi:MAG TPA: YbaK/EbsC family protein, partial [Gemmataceae bacterium]|nr:YbaK/EbsC family protein [Gemmataceae bacterium]